MKKSAAILLFLCSAAVACNKENTVTPDLGDRDPVDLLRAAETATGFERALVLERLGLTKEAIAAWDALVSERSRLSREARRRRDRLRNLPDPTSQWSTDAVDEALARRDRAALARMAQAFPAEAARYCMVLTVRNRDAARLLANVLAAEGERYSQAILEAMDRPDDPRALEQGLVALKNRDHARAIALLERAGNPLRLALLYSAAAAKYITAPDESLLLLDAATPHLKPEYRELSARIHMFRANVLEAQGRYFEAHSHYAAALAADDDPTSQVATLSRRSANYLHIGSAEQAFRDSHRAIALLNRVPDLNARHKAYATAAEAATWLGQPLTGLHYQNAAVEEAQKAVARAARADLAVAKRHLAIGLRERADIHVELGHYEDASGDLVEAFDLADAIDNPVLRRLLQMRVHEVRGQWRMSVDDFTRAIELAQGQDSTYRASLHYKRAAAYRKHGDHTGAARDLETARSILRAEAKQLVDTTRRGQYEELWTPYFSRFESMHHELIESRIADDDVEGAFVEAELARALEPMQLLLRSKARPRAFESIEDQASLRQHLDELPEDTVILQYAVMDDKTYTWVLTRGKIELIRLRATKADIDKWAADAARAARNSQRDPFIVAMRDAYAELFRDPLGSAALKTRIVVVPDGPMHRLPIYGLRGTDKEGYLIERGSIAIAGSTSLYLYALKRDRDFDAAPREPSVLLVGDPAFHPDIKLPRLKYAKAEVEQLNRDYYPDAELLTGAEATAERLLAQAPNATIVHFAGHAIANPHQPWLSRLILAPEGKASGELTAERLMKELSELERTRLVVLGACSTADGQTVGSRGLASLVRPLIAANVPAVVGTLWNVNDATTKDLLVSLHCHYRHGDDVAVALRMAQLEMLRNDKPAMKWAAFQVVGHAGSPYPRPVALEEPHSEHVCTQDSLLWPDGLHPQ